MKVYLAARYSQKDEMNIYAEDLRKMGYTVTASWIAEPHAPGTKLDEIPKAKLWEYQLQDLRDIDEADGLIFFSQDPTTPTVRGGRHVEFGYALAQRKPILVVGPRENIFHYNINVTQVDSWLEALNLLRRPKEGRIA
jgi:hypothetical protein